MMQEPEQRPQEKQEQYQQKSIMSNIENVPLNGNSNNGNVRSRSNSQNVSVSFANDEDDSTEHTPKSQGGGDDDYDDDDDNSSVKSGGSKKNNKKRSSSTTSNTKNQMHVAERETNAVKCLKVTFILLLTVLAGVLSGFIYMRIHRNEVDEFETDFIDRSFMIYDHVFLSKMSSKLNTVNSLSISVTTTTSDDTSSAWPFVTIPDFDIRAMTAAAASASTDAIHGDSSSSGSASEEVILAPLVATNDRYSWENYVQSQLPTWLPMAIERSSTFSNVGNVPSTSIWKYDKDDDDNIGSRIQDLGVGQQYYFPIWHYSPVKSGTAPIINYNLVNNDNIFQDGLLTTLETNQAILGEVVKNYDDSSSSTSLVSSILEGSLLPRSSSGHEYYGKDGPTSVLYYPVFDKFGSTTTEETTASSSSSSSSSSSPSNNSDNDSDIPTHDDETVKSSPSLVAILLSTVNWSQLFSNILPSDDVGYICVLSNACEQNFTFQLNGPNAVFVGEGDLHNSQYDYLGESFYLNETFALRSSSLFPGLDIPDVQLLDDYCPYSLHIYPSQDLESTYISETPLFLSICVGAVFLVTVLVFVIYDGLVERRQRLVMKFALESHAIVSSFFPQTVRARLFGATGLGMLTGRRKSQMNVDPAGAGATGGGSGQQRKASSNEFPPSGPEGMTLETGSSGVNGSGEHKKKTKEVLSRSSHHKRNNKKQQAAFEGGFQSPKKQLQSMVETNLPEITVLETPIADLFPNSTVFFADIAGFTAWSSQREPTQVFTLLQTLYHAFDRVANKRSVFKVETIGDCYMAVTGVPNPQDDHALRMTRFAKECLHQMDVITKGLEVRLGPDTGDLTLRVGIHSGPVTAGVLLGEKSRFQLFGDTVNTASRMESTGEKNRIQASQATANLLIEAGKGSWIIPRNEKVTAKGKGEMQTYWIAGKGQNAGRRLERSNSGGLDGVSRYLPSQVSTRHLQLQVKNTPVDDEKYRRMIEWQVDLLAQMLKKIQWVRLGKKKEIGSRTRSSSIDDASLASQGNTIVLDEVSEEIEFPKTNNIQGPEFTHPDSIELESGVLEQLRKYVTSIAGLYRLNTFHNFEHASHVTQAIQKFLHRIEADNEKGGDVSATEGSHRVELGAMFSDPLTSFAIVFAGLVHDVDHPGMSNEEVIKGDPHLAEFYRHRSVNEQNSVDIAWGMLREPAYGDLLRCICEDGVERRRFRQVLVNSVIATDLFDTEMQAWREGRFKRAFVDSTERHNMINLKITLIIEYMMQAADLAHTMQHWTIYHKFNQSLFEEEYATYESGRSDTDPSRKWHKGELEFFDKIVLPLAEKLDKCGVFGVASQECLAYARANKQELVAKGEDVVRDMASKLQQQKFSSTMKKTPGVAKGENRRQQRRFSTMA